VRLSSLASKITVRQLLLDHRSLFLGLLPNLDHQQLDEAFWKHNSVHECQIICVFQPPDSPTDCNPTRCCSNAYLALTYLDQPTTVLYQCKWTMCRDPGLTPAHIRLPTFLRFPSYAQPNEFRMRRYNPAGCVAPALPQSLVSQPAAGK
jgi:hypothetical protein